MQCGRLRPTIGYAYLDEEVFRRLLRILHKDVEVAIFVEDSGIQQFILHVATITSLVRLDQFVIRKRSLGILVQILHVGVGGRAVEVKVVFFDVLAVVGLAVRKTERTFLKDWIFAIPQGHAKAQQLLVIADAGKTILAPVIRARSGLVMGEVVPGIAVLAVIFSNRTPLPFAEIGSPFSPRRLRRTCCL